MTAVDDALPAEAPGPVLVALSGGLDSSVLLHALAARADQRARGLRAIHVHHGLHAEADAWAVHCQALCAQLGIPLEVSHVVVARDSGLGLEGAARAARRAAFATALRPGEWLALAHHRDDQAETFLLRALRGSGPDGLAAMHVQRAFGAGQLWRPLLELPREALADHAHRHGLRWIEDPANADPHHDRNFVRHHVLPLLRERWPHAGAALARSAALSGEASALLATDDQAWLDAHADAGAARLDLPALRTQPPARRARLLRAWVARHGAPPLPASGIAAIEHELAAADDGARFVWAGVQVRRWRTGLHLLRPPLDWPAAWQAHWDGRAPLALPDGGELALLGADQFDAPLRVTARRGGERLRLPGREQSHELKHLLQAAAVPPWRRGAMPLLWQDDALLAAGDQLVGAALSQWLHARGARLRWTPPGPAN